MTKIVWEVAYRASNHNHCYAYDHIPLCKIIFFLKTTPSRRWILELCVLQGAKHEDKLKYEVQPTRRKRYKCTNRTFLLVSGIQEVHTLHTNI